MTEEQEKASADASKAEQDKEKQDQAQEAKKSDKDKKDLSKDEAKRFLSAFERDQKENPLLNQQKSRRGRGYYVEKDW
jgi:regulator of protease activity HflC (stomatin/prohibitin superfamily)